MTDSNNDRISIGEASEKTKLPESTIRYYDSEFSEFLNISRGPNNERLFTRENLKDLEYIRFLIKREDLSVEEVKDRLETEEQFEGSVEQKTPSVSGEKTVPESRALEEKIDELSSEMEQIKQQLQQMDGSQQQILELLDMNLRRYNKVVERLPD
jgi:DNA-binding transcriptional MerR regulator